MNLEGMGRVHAPLLFFIKPAKGWRVTREQPLSAWTFHLFRDSAGQLQDSTVPKAPSGTRARGTPTRRAPGQIWCAAGATPGLCCTAQTSCSRQLRLQEEPSASLLREE